MADDPGRTKTAPVDRLSQIWRRLNEHKIVQWTVAYLALAYALQHALTLTGEAFEWPRAVLRLSMLLFALGLPLVVTFAWYHGARASRNFSQAELSILATLLVGVSLLFYAFVRPSEPAATAGVTQEASVTAARQASLSPKGAISVAVLPFLNLSSDKEQEFFSDGMTEEITAALAKVPDLRVIARTSAFEFKGKNVDIESIGRQLHATHLIEGSVRKAGNRLRITAQLIKADDGTHIWAEDYDLELTDVFAIQEDIARAITSSLHMTLGLTPGENLVNSRSIDPDSYENYLRARAIIDQRQSANYEADLMMAVSLLEGVTVKNPGYAPAWGWAGAGYYLWAANESQQLDQPITKIRAVVDELRDKGEAAARRAIEVAPSDPGGYAALALLTWSRGKSLDSDALSQKALQLADQSGGEGYALRLGETGSVKEALALHEKSHIADPLNPTVVGATIIARWVVGDDDGAIALARTVRPVTRAPLLAMIYASRGDFSGAADALGEIANNGNSAAGRAAVLLRRAPAKILPEELPALPRNLQFVYLYVGAPQRTLDIFERQVALGFVGGAIIDEVWHPSYAPVRRTERFRSLMRKAGFVEYWRAKGWPPQCHPTTGDDFECS